MKVTKKLRDVTKEEWQNWQKYNCKGERCTKCIFKCVSCLTREYMSWIDNKEIFSDKFLDQTIEVEVPDILTNEEKEYLSTVIKPYRDRIISIAKITASCNNREAILITYTETSTRDFRLPDFPKYTMYNNMSNGIAYKIEELGL